MTVRQLSETATSHALLAHSASGPVIETAAGSAPDFIATLISDNPGPAVVLGLFPTAAYLELSGGEVIALLTRDAVALPIGIVLAIDSSRRPLTRFDGPARVRDGFVELGGLTARVHPGRRVWSGTAGTDGTVGSPVPERVAVASRRVAAVFDRCGIGPMPAMPARASDHREWIAGLLGRGHGLTPSGDDLLCGLLAGGVLFGRDVSGLRAAVLSELTGRPRATTSLSAALLRAAVHGAVIAPLGGLGRALCDRGRLDSHSDVERDREQDAAMDDRLDSVLAIGHSSGVALAAGLLLSCELPGPTRMGHPMSEVNR